MSRLIKGLQISGLVGAFLLTTVFTSVLTTTHFIAKTPSRTVIINQEESKPSYDYLKSITVYLEGEGSGEKVGFIYALTGQTKDTTKKWTGTGVIVKVDEQYTYVLTNNHVAGKEFQTAHIFIKETDKIRSQVEIVEYHQEYDMALLRIAKKYTDKQAVKGFNTVAPQDKVYVVGHYLGIPYIYSEGVVAGWEKESADGILLQLPACFGNSGSGVINAQGELSALIYAVHSVGLFSVDTSKSIAVDGDKIIAFLNKHNILDPKVEIE